MIPNGKTTETKPLVKVTAIDVGPSGINESAITMTIDGTTYTTASDACVYRKSAREFYVDLKATSQVLTEGLIDVAVHLEDNAGNVFNKTYNFRVDLSGPDFIVEYYQDAACTIPLRIK